MKNLFTVLAILFASQLILAQEGKKLPSVDLQGLGGNKVSTMDIVNDNGPTVISFWATWCKPCILELNEIQDVYQDWQDETQVKIVAVSIDDTRNSRKVQPFVNGRGWDFEVYLDQNSDLKRALNINNVPFTILVSKKGEIIWQHAGYTPGDEELLYEEILKLESD